MNKENYLKDISEIKNMMSKSSKFISLSGLSGILAGCYALVGAGIAYWFFGDKIENYYQNLDNHLLNFILLDLAIISILSVTTAILLSTKKASSNNEKIWDSLTRRLLFNFITPLVVGVIYTLTVFLDKNYEQVAPLMLLFYGLALFNASKFTLGDIKYLGVTQIILGLLCAYIPAYGFWFWTIGFGLMHIIYGFIMYFKYDKK
jgi:hypothetical protein